MAKSGHYCHTKTTLMTGWFKYPGDRYGMW